MPTRRRLVGLIGALFAFPIVKPSAAEPLPAWAHEPMIVPGSATISIGQPDGSFLEIKHLQNIQLTPLSPRHARIARAMLRTFGEVGPDGPFLRTDRGELRIKGR